MSPEHSEGRWAVFVVVTHFQALVAEAMVRGLSELQRRPVVILSNGRELTRHRSYPDGVRVRPIDPVPIRFFDGGARRAREALDRVVEELAPAGIEFFVANVDHPLGNRALYLSRRRGDLFQLSVYPEGIANIVSTRPPVRKKLANLAKLLLGPFLNAPFYPYGSDLGGEHLAERRFSLLPVELFPGEADAIHVSLEHVIERGTTWEAEGTVVLGQPLDHVGSRAAAERLQQELLAVSRGCESPRWYKPHPRERRWSVDMARQGGCRLIEDDRPAEEVIIELSPAVLLSFFSSGLVHTKLLLGDRIECVAVSPAEAMKVAGDTEERWRELREVYSKLGIRVHGVS